VTLGSRVAGGVLVKAGARSGERVIVDGLFKARPGSEVKAVPAKAEAAPTGAAAKGAAPAKDAVRTPDAKKK
jgi:membrane fusion protein (multidrug efflux system)